MANIQTRITADNKVMYKARIRIKGFPATNSNITKSDQAAAQYLSSLGIQWHR